MRIFSIVTAVLVMVALYLVVFERDALVTFASGNDAATETAAPADEAMTEAEAARIVPVVAMKSTARSIDSAVLLRGETAAARQVDVRAETTSTVISEPLRKGSHVEAGQLLCELDAGSRAASLAQAQAALTSARTELEQAEKLSQDGYASQTRLINARAGLEQAQAALRAAETEIDNLTIKAPFAGLLETDTAELGSFLAAGGLCATVIQLDPIKLVGYVPEADVGRISVGAMAGAELITGDRVTGLVTFLSRSADAATRTFRVEIEVPNTDLAIRDGQTATIAIAADGRSAHLLPQSALTLDDDGTLGVRTLDAEAKALFYPVSILRDTRDGVWVSGLPDQVSVIIVGQEYVVDGVQTAPTYREATQ